MPGQEPVLSARTMLQGERVTLRRLDARDAPALFALYADPEVMRYWSHAPWTAIGEAHAEIEQAQADYASGASLHCAIELNATGSLIGSCALYALERRNRCATLGYLLARRYWGQGLLSDALRALLEHGFEALALNRVEAVVHRNNTGSARVLDKLGFRREGCLRERWIVQGCKHDTDAYGLLSADWRGETVAGGQASGPRRSRGRPC